MRNEERRHLDTIAAAAHMNTGARRWQATAGDSNVSVYAGIFVYHTAAEGLSHGTSLGNARAWVASKGTGEIESLFSVEVGQEVLGPMAINYYSPRHEYLYAGGNAPGDGVQNSEKPARTPLPPVRHGDFHFHPAYQQRSTTLVGSVEALETLFVPRNAAFDDPAAVYHVVRLVNSSISTKRVTLLGALHLPGNTARDVEGRYDEKARALVAWNKSNRDWVRVYGLIPEPDDYAITLDLEEAYYPTGPQDNRTRAVGETFGTLEKTVELAPNEEKVVAFLTIFSPRGEEDALELYRRYADYEQAFADTVEFYHRHLMVSQVLTPDLMLNQGAQWSKANMLRVMQRYAYPNDVVGFTNDPGRGSNLVVRDAAWFTIGCDYLMPEISKQLLEAIAKLQEDSGKIIEYWSGIDGRTEDYGLNINDNTPLFICAVAHHMLCTGNIEFGRRLYPVLEKAARYILSQRDERGLVCCTATGTGVHGIAGWRNIIEDRTISGAVTEINSECFAALYATGVIAQALGKAKEAEEFVTEANKLRDSINKHLKNPNNGLYYLTSNMDGVNETTVTADLVFPMIFSVADDQTTGLIMQRLLAQDFRTQAGLRTLSSKNPLYRPDSYVGLLGGVWPGVTWWFALACARYDSSLIVDSLVSSYQHYLRDPGTYNTVPGQFSEWFDGETLINRGMRLSPWEPPRYLWALLEGAMGFGIQIPVPEPGRDALATAPNGVRDALRSQNRISPVIPKRWQWFVLRNVPMNGQSLSYFAVRLAPEVASEKVPLTLFGVGEFESPYPVRFFQRDVSGDIYSLASDVAAVAFAEEIGEGGASIVVLFGNMSNESRVAPVEAGRLFDPNATYAGRVYIVEQGGWIELETRPGTALAQFAFQIEAYEFRLCEFRKVS